MFAPHPSVGGVYENAGRPFGLTASAPELERAFRAAWKRQSHSVMGDEESSRGWWRNLVEDVFDSVDFHGSRDHCFEAFFTAFARKDAWRLFDDVLPALEGLRAQGVRLGVLSNWDYRLRGLLDEFQLAQYFEVILISSELGFAKPDARIFQLALERAGVSPQEIVHTGDDLELDITPARAAGFRAHLVDRTGRRGNVALCTDLLKEARK